MAMSMLISAAGFLVIAAVEVGVQGGKPGPGAGEVHGVPILSALDI